MENKDDRKRQALENKWRSHQDKPIDKAVEAQWKLFNEWTRATEVDAMQLEQYTSLLQKGDAQPYFTHLLERKTDKCGKYTTYSTGYGIYRALSAGRDKPAYGTRATQSKERGLLDHAEAAAFFETTIRPVLGKLSRYEDCSELNGLDVNFARKVGYMYQPGKLLPLFKNDVIRAIVAFFNIPADEDQLSGYKATALIREHLVREWKIEAANDFELSHKLGGFLYLYFGKSFDIGHKNVIYYGAPGTGKTHTVTEAVRQFIALDGDEEHRVKEFAQFHPSYTYEDFIEGLKPVNTANGIALELQSGRFKRFCKRAMDTLRAERAENQKVTSFYFIADEINRAELSRVLGEVLVCLEESKRVDFQNGAPTGLLLKTQNAHLDSDGDAVLTIDGEHYFGVPSNLYFIGTMNDIDRSIDSFDMALRRRFVWQRMDCNYEVVRETFAQDARVDEYVEACMRLNDFICNKLEMGSAYEIGHAYFMGLDRRIGEGALRELFSTRIAPLLTEYLRAEYSQKEIEAKLKEASDKFSLSKAGAGTK